MNEKLVESGHLMNQGVVLLNEGKFDDAKSIFAQASQISPEYYGPWFNLGLALKAQHDWPKCLAAFEKAKNLFPANIVTDVYAATYWNIGIAATVMQRWEKAYNAWYTLGFEVRRDTEGVPFCPLGYAWVNLSPEFAIGTRIDPVRIRLSQPSKHMDRVLPKDSIVIHDGSKIGTRSFESSTYPVYPLLHIVDAE